eukprot:829689-Prorocentrum_minimum.AAC.1
MSGIGEMADSDDGDGGLGFCQVAQLEAQKQAAVEAEDYDSAKMLKVSHFCNALYPSRSVTVAFE